MARPAQSLLHDTLTDQPRSAGLCKHNPSPGGFGAGRTPACTPGPGADSGFTLSLFPQPGPPSLPPLPQTRSPSHAGASLAPRNSAELCKGLCATYCAGQNGPLSGEYRNRKPLISSLNMIKNTHLKSS